MPSGNESQSASTGEAQADSVCLGCSCACDDIEVVVQNDAIVEARRACELGVRWFQQPRALDLAPLVNGRPVDYKTAIHRAAEILARAKSPLVCGLSRVDSLAQRRATAIADSLGALLDSEASRRHAARLRAVQMLGEVTCTYGEIAGRSELIVYWGANPARRQPRHAERYALRQASDFVTGARHCVLISSESNETDAWATETIRLAAGSDLAASSILRALVRGIAIDPDLAEQQTGVPLATWQGLAERMASSQYGALLYGEQITGRADGHLVVESLINLAIELNEHTRFVSMGLAAEGNATGADEALTWTTGYPSAIRFSETGPRHYFNEYGAEALLARKEVDAALVVGQFDLFSDSARRHLNAIPSVVLDWRQPDDLASVVFLSIAIPGIESGGTAYRGDGVPLPIRQLLPPSQQPAAQVLSDLLAAIRDRKGSA